MRRQALRVGFIGLLLAVGTMGVPCSSPAQTESFGGIEPGRWVVGFRAGFSPLTQQLSEGTSTSIGPLVNFQGLYSVNTWLLAGIMLEWERHGVSAEARSQRGGPRYRPWASRYRVGITDHRNSACQIGPDTSLRQHELRREYQQFR